MTRPASPACASGRSGSGRKRPTPSSAVSPGSSTKRAGICAGSSSGSWTCVTDPEFCEAVHRPDAQVLARLVPAVSRRGGRRRGRDHDRRRPGRPGRTPVQPGDLPPAGQAAPEAPRPVHPVADAGEDLVPHLRLVRCLYPRPHRQRHPHPEPGPDERPRTWTPSTSSDGSGGTSSSGAAAATPSTSCRAAPPPRSPPTSGVTSRRSCPAAATSSTASTTSRARCRPANVVALFDTAYEEGFY